MNYKKVIFASQSQEEREMLMALLTDAGFEGFEEEEDTLLAYIVADEFDEVRLQEIAGKLQVHALVSEVQSQNWNEVWESNFQPVVVENFCSIRASFHPPAAAVAHEIIITPKMSFGTGHHATTYMMISQMKEIDFQGKRVLDFGTGTGILAILASRLGAIHVDAVDNDPWSIENANENVVNNACMDVACVLKDNADHNGRYDIVLANITRNVILENLDHFVNHTRKGSVLLVSGLLSDDEEQITRATEAGGFIVSSRLQRDKWICIRFEKNR